MFAFVCRRAPPGLPAATLLPQQQRTASPDELWRAEVEGKGQARSTKPISVPTQDQITGRIKASELKVKILSFDQKIN